MRYHGITWFFRVWVRNTAQNCRVGQASLSDAGPPYVFFQPIMVGRLATRSCPTLRPRRNALSWNNLYGIPGEILMKPANVTSRGVGLVVALWCGAIAIAAETPLILTPPSAAQPRINGPTVFAARPGSPFFYSIPATGDRPIEFSVEELPALAKEKGIPIIVIGPKYTDAAETWADQWIPIRPATDMAMTLAVANVTLQGNLYDADFVSKFVEPTGFQKWKDYVLGNAPGYDGSDGKTSPDGAIDRTPEWAAPICGVPAATIRAFAELYARSKPACLIFGVGGVRQTRGMNQVELPCTCKP